MDEKKTQNESTIRIIKRKMEQAAPGMVNHMFSTLYNPATPPATKVKIYEMILDRLMGKPEATIRLEDNTGSMEEAEAVVAKIAERIRNNARKEKEG